MSARRINWRAVAYWAAWFFAWVFALIAIGAVVGAVAFPLWGLVVGSERTAAELIVKGARFMSFIFMIWAPAVALVACTMKAWRRANTR